MSVVFIKIFYYVPISYFVLYLSEVSWKRYQMTSVFAVSVLFMLC